MSVPVEAISSAGEVVVLAKKLDDQSPVAQCVHPGCPTAIQRTVTGSLADGVRAHYRTVHPERRLR